MSRRSSSWAVATGTAGAGLLAGHAATYFTLPSPVRDHVLTSTGHGYFDGATQAAVFGALVTMLAVAAGTLADRTSANSATVRFRGLAGRLALLQASGFVAVELVERLLSGSVTHHLDPGFVAFGVLLQLAFALLAAALVRLVARAAQAFAATAARVLPGVSASTRLRVTPQPFAPGRPARPCAAPRAPPLAA